MTPHTPRPEPTREPAAPRKGTRGTAFLYVVVAASASAAITLSTMEPSRTSLGAPAATAPATKSHPVVIRQPVDQPRVDTGTLDALGHPVTVSCGSCHATSRPRIETRSAAELDEFHQGLRYDHGSLTCLSCHDATNYDRLRLADGRGLPYPDAMTLCAQCHGPQFRDYTRGSHGGMTGYWDLSKGPRQRNHCVDCHDPHSPQYPLVLPAFPLPPDRGQLTESSRTSRHD